MAQENNRKLCQAARKGQMDGENSVRSLALDLIKHDGDLNFSEKPFFRTAVYEACDYNQEPALKFLLEKNCSMDVQDYMGRTGLHAAAYRGYKNIVNILLEQKAGFLQDGNGQTPL